MSALGRLAKLLLALGPVSYAFAYSIRPQHVAGLDHLPVAGLDHLNGMIHAAGHSIFNPMGPILGALGGSLAQVAFPATIALILLLFDWQLAAAVALTWLGQNLFAVSAYAADARSQELPLATSEGGRHDWNSLLDQVGLLTQDQPIARLIHVIGFVVLVLALILGLRRALRMGRPV